MNILNILDLSSLRPDLLLGFAGKDICIHEGGLGAEALLYQVNDIVQPLFNDLSLTMAGSAGTEEEIRNNACYFEMDCDGIKSMAIRGSVAFPRSTLLPDNAGEIVTDGQVNGYFEMTLDRNVPLSESAYAYRGEEVEDPVGSHIMLGLTMDPFQIAGLSGWSFVVQEATMDLSDLENPETMIFPEGYSEGSTDGSGLDFAGDTSNLWQGFHLKSLQVLTPPNMTEGTRRSFGITDLIIDPQPSLSVKAEGTELIQVGSGNLEGWGFSLDTFSLHIVQNTLLDGRMIGKVNTPLIGPGDYLSYRAIINRNEEEQYVFNAIATPDSLISLPMVVAKAALCPNSFIQFQLAPDSTKLATFLAGEMSIDVTNNLPDSLRALDLLPELSIRLADFQFNYNTEQGFVTEEMTSAGDHSSFGFGLEFQSEICGTMYSGPIFEDTDQPEYNYDVSDMGAILREGIADEAGTDDPSPQESVSGFPLSINNFDFAFEGDNINLDLTVGVHLSNSGNSEISGSASIAVVSTLKLEQLKIKRFSLDSIRLECVNIGSEENPIDLDLFTLWGGACFKDYNGGKGFEGEIHFGVADAFELDLYAGFGQYGTPDLGDYGTENYYGWWYLDGTARFSPGITLVPTPPVMLSGFGGGIYWNVDAPHLSLNIEDVMAMAEGEASMPEFDPAPQYGTRSLAFRTSMSIAEDNVFSIDPEIAVTWDVDDGIQAISFNGDFFVMSTDYFDRENTSRLYGSSMNSLTFEYGSDGKKRVAIVGANSIKADIIPNVLYGAGPDKTLVESAFAFGHESLFADYGIDHGDADNQYWFFNAGNPYV
ncbi:MAG: hypothetical protein AAFU67_09510, partial [Bacteroidota bacterium]